jgi:hypothetical protein
MSPIKVGDLILFDFWGQPLLGYVVRVEHPKNSVPLYHTRMFKEERLFILNDHKRGIRWDLV